MRHLCVYHHNSWQSATLLWHSRIISGPDWLSDWLAPLALHRPLTFQRCWTIDSKDTVLLSDAALPSDECSHRQSPCCRLWPSHSTVCMLLAPMHSRSFTKMLYPTSANVRPFMHKNMKNESTQQHEYIHASRSIAAKMNSSNFKNGKRKKEWSEPGSIWRPPRC